MTHGNIGSWKKQPGDEIAAGDVVCDVETDKAVRARTRVCRSCGVDSYESLATTTSTACGLLSEIPSRPTTGKNLFFLNHQVLTKVVELAFEVVARRRVRRPAILLYQPIRP